MFILKNKFKLLTILFLFSAIGCENKNSNIIKSKTENHETITITSDSIVDTSLSKCTELSAAVTPSNMASKIVWTVENSADLEQYGFSLLNNTLCLNNLTPKNKSTEVKIKASIENKNIFDKKTIQFKGRDDSITPPLDLGSNYKVNILNKVTKIYTAKDRCVNLIGEITPNDGVVSNIIWSVENEERYSEYDYSLRGNLLCFNKLTPLNHELKVQVHAKLSQTNSVDSKEFIFVGRNVNSSEENYTINIKEVDNVNTQVDECVSLHADILPNSGNHPNITWSVPEAENYQSIGLELNDNELCVRNLLNNQVIDIPVIASFGDASSSSTTNILFIGKNQGISVKPGENYSLDLRNTDFKIDLNSGTTCVDLVAFATPKELLVSWSSNNDNYVKISKGKACGINVIPGETFVSTITASIDSPNGKIEKSFNLTIENTYDVNTEESKPYIRLINPVSPEIVTELYVNTNFEVKAELVNSREYRNIGYFGRNNEINKNPIYTLKANNGKLEYEYQNDSNNGIIEIFACKNFYDSIGAEYTISKCDPDYSITPIKLYFTINKDDSSYYATYKIDNTDIQESYTNNFKSKTYSLKVTRSKKDKVYTKVNVKSNKHWLKVKEVSRNADVVTYNLIVDENPFEKTRNGVVEISVEKNSKKQIINFEQSGNPAHKGDIIVREWIHGVDVSKAIINNDTKVGLFNPETDNDVFFKWYEAKGQGWFNTVKYDAMNDSINTDFNMCWAKAASSALHHWFESNKSYIDLYNNNKEFVNNVCNVTYNYESKNELDKSSIEKVFRHTFRDVGGYPKPGMESFIFSNNRAAKQDSKFLKFPQCFNDVFTYDDNLILALGTGIKTFEDIVTDSIANGSYIVIGVKYSDPSTPGTNGGQHSIFVSGAVYDENDKLVEVYLADSNVPGDDAIKNIKQRAPLLNMAVQLGKNDNSKYPRIRKDNLKDDIVYFAPLYNSKDIKVNSHLIELIVINPGRNEFERYFLNNNIQINK